MIRNMANITRKFIGSASDVDAYQFGEKPSDHYAHSSEANLVHSSHSPSAFIRGIENSHLAEQSLLHHYQTQLSPDGSCRSLKRMEMLQSDPAPVALSSEQNVDCINAFSSVPSRLEFSNVSCIATGVIHHSCSVNVDESKAVSRNHTKESPNKNKEILWKRNTMKRLKNHGKAYITQSGKEVNAKEFKPVIQCCNLKCFKNICEEDQKSGFDSYWSLGNWNKQTKFLWDHIHIRETKRKTVDANSRRVHTRLFHITISGGKQVKVCKKMFLDLLQISNGRLSYTLGQKLVAGVHVYPNDKRGLNEPHNKTPPQAVKDAEKYIQSLPYYKINSSTGRSVFSVPQGLTIRKVYSTYQRTFQEAGMSPISIKVFRKLIPDIHKTDALSVPLPLVSYQEYEKSKEVTLVEQGNAENAQKINQILRPSTFTCIEDQSDSICSAGRTRQCVPQTTDELQNSCSQGHPSVISADSNSANNYFENNKIPTGITESKSSYTVRGFKVFDLENKPTAPSEPFPSTSASSHEHEPSHEVHCNLIMKTNVGTGWNRTIRKKLRDEGKSYVAPSGKVVWGKEFIPQYTCCFKKCYQLIPVEQQEILFKKYWSLGLWNLQTKFLWDHIEIKSTKSLVSKTRNSRKVYTRLFYLYNHDGERKKVCKVFFCTTLQISNGRLSRALNSKMNDVIDMPQDKRGKKAPGNKSSVENNEFMILCIQQMLQQFSLPADMTIKAAHESYKNTCFQQRRRALCYTLFARAVHSEISNGPENQLTSI